MEIDVIFCLFGNEVERPPVENVRKYFPEAKLILYTDGDKATYETGVDEVYIRNPEDYGIMRSHERYGWRAVDFFKAQGLYESPADVAIYFDNDILIVSDNVRSIIPLTQKFGACVPMNPRYTVYKDWSIGTDVTTKEKDESGYWGHATNQAILTCSNDMRGKCFWNNYMAQFRKNPERGPFVNWRTMWNTGFMPCILPPQWCVCKSHIGVGDEIVLHIGHHEVKKHYMV
jgi:hypothetical protein